MLWWITVARCWHVLVRIGIATIAVSAATALQLPFEVGVAARALTSAALAHMMAS
jgi:hypothetical protein